MEGVVEMRKEVVGKIKNVDVGETINEEVREVRVEEVTRIMRGSELQVEEGK